MSGELVVPGPLTATKHHELQQRRTELMLREGPADAAPWRIRYDLDPR